MGDSGPLVFVSAVGQDDNLGDTVLRRSALDALRNDVVVLHVFVGRSSESYVRGLGLLATDRQYRSGVMWRLMACVNAVWRPTAFVFSPGELVIEKRSRLGFAVDWCTAAVFWLRNRPMIHAGLGLRDPALPIPAAYRWVLKRCRVVAWRDEGSRKRAAVGDFAPDYAFSTSRKSVEEPGRSQLTLVFRGDRPGPTPQFEAFCRDLAVRLGLELTVLVQVRRDGPRAIEWARALGARLIDWPDQRDHADHERVVRAAFRRSSLVVADRLHGLIIALTEGANVIGVESDGRGKLSRSLALESFDPLIVRANDLPHIERAVEQLSRLEVHGMVHSANASVVALNHRVDSAILGRQPDRAKY